MVSSKYGQFLMIVISLVFSCVNSQSSDSCNNGLNLQSPLPFDTSSLHCVSVWQSENYILRYMQESSNVWNFVLSAPSSNVWIGIGFSPNGNMIGSDAIVGWVGSNGVTAMQKYFLQGQRPELVVVQTQDQGLRIRNSSISAPTQSNRIYMAFQMLIDQPTSRLLYAIGQPGDIPSAPSFRLIQHRDMISTNLNYASGQFETAKSPQENLKKGHGIVNMLGWAILLPIGAMVARYLRKWDPQWFYAHAIIQTLGFILGLSGVIIGLVLDNRLQADVPKHKALGIIILTLGCLQILALFIRPGKSSKVRKYWNWYHSSVGRVLIVLAVINVFYGIHLGGAGSSWNAGFAVVIVILFIITLVMELRMWLKD